MSGRLFFLHYAAVVARGTWLRKRINRLMFCAAAARKNCSRTNFILRKRSRRSPIWFREQRFYLLSLPLCVREAVLLRKEPPRTVKSTRPHSIVSNTELPLGCVSQAHWIGARFVLSDLRLINWRLPMPARICCAALIATSAGTDTLTTPELTQIIAFIN